MINMIKKISILFILLSMFIFPRLYASSYYEAVDIGKVEVGQEIFIYNTQRYTIYKVKGKGYLLLDDLKQMGLNVTNKNDILYLKETQEVKEDHQTFNHTIEGKVATMYPLPIYCGNIRSFSLQVDDKRLIPLEVLEAIWQIKQDKGIYLKTPYLNNSLNLIQIDEEGISNQTDHLLPLTCRHLYWNGKAYESIEEAFILEPWEKKNWEIDTKQQYITTYIVEMSELPPCKVSDSIYGQKHIETFQQYSQSIRLNELKELFPPYVVLAQMKYNVGSFKEKEIVELCRSEKHLYLLVRNNDGTKYQVPYNSVHILGEKGARLSPINKEDIEEFATLSGIQSATDYLIWTDVYRQRTYVLKRSENSWQLEKTLVCSTGKNNNPTPTGLYEVQYMIPYIGVTKGYRCKYALVFFRDYMYHSILFDKTGKYVKSGQYELGSKASHGCVRLSEKDSAWLYTHIPVKSTVWIR